MRDTPPDTLVTALGELGLAEPGQIAAVGHRVRRLARELPGFEVVWIDALVQQRVLTHFQAAQVHAGHSKRLAVGPHVLDGQLARLGYATCYRARERATGRRVALIVSEPLPGSLLDEKRSQAEALIRRGAAVGVRALATVEAVGVWEDRLWFAARDVPAVSAAEWMLRHGRFHPHVVLSIARQIVAPLEQAAQAGLVHGGLSPAHVLLAPTGEVVISAPGVRPLLRPTEGYSDAGLPPEAYDHLAPEQAHAAASSSLASDVYATGAVLWHLLAGRPPVPGATGLAKLRALQTHRIQDIRALAPETPPPLVHAIHACLERNPALRPRSFLELAETLGKPEPKDLQTVARHLRGRAHGGWATTQPDTRWSRPWLGRLAMASLAAVLVTAILAWPALGIRGPVRQRGRSTASGEKNRPTPTPIQQPLVAVGTQIPNANTDAAPKSEADAWPLSGGSVRAADLQLKPGQTVGSPRARTTIEVEPGWTIGTEDVTFLNVDFIQRQGSADSERSLLIVTARRIDFRGCRWNFEHTLPLEGVRWQLEPGISSDALPVGRLRMHECLLRRVSAGVRLTVVGSQLVELENTLCLGPGPLVRLDELPAAERSLHLSLGHVTLRGGRSLLESGTEAGEGSPGRLSVEARDCAFALPDGTPLLNFLGDADPAPWLSELEWKGQGSVLEPGSPVAQWHDSQGQLRATAGDQVQVAGLVHSRVSFAGSAEADAGASQIIRWQVPLQSTEPPGIRGDFGVHDGPISGAARPDGVIAPR